MVAMMVTMMAAMMMAMMVEMRVARLTSGPAITPSGPTISSVTPTAWGGG